MWPRISAFVEKSLFAPMPSADIRLFRALYCGSLFLFSIGRQSWYHKIIAEGILETSQFHYYHFIIFGLPFWQWLEWLLPISLLLAVLGIAARVTLVASFLTFVLYFFPVDWQLRPHDNNLVFVVLLILCLSPGVAANSSDQIPRWPRSLIIAILGLVYFSSSVCKLRQGLVWMNGETLQAYLVERYIVTSHPASLWLANQPTLCKWLSIATVLGELAFLPAMFFAKSRKVMIALGVTAHFAAFFIMRVNFLRFFLITYLIFADTKFFHKLLASLRRRDRPEDRTTENLPRPAHSS